MPVADLYEIAAAIAPARHTGAQLVLANGAFDLLHVGHLRYLQAARAAGDILVVGINSDASVRRAKGPPRPYVPDVERAELIAALTCVDWVVLFDTDTIVPLVTHLRPNLHAKGTDYTPNSVPEKSVVQAWGGRIIIVGDPKNHSTTEIAAKLQKTGL